ncbi:MAG: sialidase, partial [Verrucomicrobiales bacterium]
MMTLHCKTLWASSLLLALASPGQADDPPSSLAAFFRIPPAFAQQTSPGESPLVFANGQPVTSPEQWPLRRDELLKRWQDLLGEWPPLIEHPSVELLDSTDREGITQQRIRFLWTPREQTEGYLLI